MTIEYLPSYDGLSTVVCTAVVEDMSTIRIDAGCSIAWFISAERHLDPAHLRVAIAALIAMSPCLVHVFGKGSERIHDELDLALHEANQAAVTIWSEQYIPDQAIFDIFRVDFPPEEAVGQWSSRLIIFDEAMPADERATLLEKLRDPDSSIRDYLAQQ